MLATLPEVQRAVERHFVGAGLVRGRIRRAVIWRDDLVRQHPLFDFIAADVGQHVTVDLDARAQHLAALLDHLGALDRVVDDVAIFVGQIVFAEDGADAVAPAAGRLQVGNDFWFAHKIIN